MPRENKLTAYVSDIIKEFNGGTRIYTAILNGNTIVSVGSELVLEAFRVAVVENQINCKDIVFIFNEEEIKIDRMGNLSSWPSGFMETHNSLLFRLIKPRADAAKTTNKKEGEGS